MKRTIHIIIVSAFALCASSCHFLEVEKIGKSDIETYFSDINSLEPAMNGLYSLTFSLYDRYIIPYAEIAADNLAVSKDKGGVWIDYQNFGTDLTYETSAVGMIWKNGYNIINNANEILYYAPKLLQENPLSSDLINNVIGGAYFIRALIHFDLCLVYAQNYTFTPDASHLGVALRDRIPSLSEVVRRSSIKDTYTMILSDLDAALNSFSNCNYTAEYVTPLACKALKARVYLYMNDWSKAAALASEVISEKGLEKKEDYKKMFCDPSFLSDEIVFRLNGKSQSAVMYGLCKYDSPALRPADKILSLFSNKDDVRAGMFSWDKSGTVYDKIILKYAVTADVASDEYRFNNLNILRASEMYLVRAEANCNLGNVSDAIDDIKELEARALGIDKSAVDISFTGKDELAGIIAQERQKEMSFEGTRLFDITRRHESLVRDDSSTATLRELQYPDYRFILQIPRVEVEANTAMQQNPTSN
ncbi:MAG: RagB/SusD family nutrient uptake outer membrane protein [Candidatus Cryptobacteroides sp.]